MKEQNMRVSRYPIHTMFLERWSPRALSGEPITQEQLMTLFEAAHWAPSSYNNQPWRFIYAHRDSQYWKTFLNLLVPGNQEWAKNAAVLVVFISKKIFDNNNKPARTHSFDAGSAWMSLALQASLMNLFAHGMEGFDYDQARTTLNIPDDYEIEAMCAIGKLGDKKNLPEKFVAQEGPNDRKPTETLIFEGIFKS